MENVFDIRREEELYYIVDPSGESTIKQEDNSNNRIVVIMYLYYPDMLNRWIEYISAIPQYVEKIIISSNEVIIRSIECDKAFEDVKLITKPNEGRDVSALLIEAKESIANADYVCFVHDKKEHQNPKREHETDFWVTNIWDNMLGKSPKYLENVIGLFDNNKELGVLLPPEPIGYYYDTWSGKGWYGSFDATKKLADVLSLKCEMSLDKPPISIGTALWFRVPALNKLFSYDWKYSDFDDDKLANGGDYLSYGVERIFPYVAQDAGYKTGMLMTSEYAKKQTALSQDLCVIYSKTLTKLIGISSAKECMEILERYDFLEEVCKKAENIYLYGAGYWGKIISKLIRIMGYCPKAFIVSEEATNKDMNVPVLKFGEANIGCNDIVIITVSDANAIKSISKKKKKKNYNYFAFWE